MKPVAGFRRSYNYNNNMFDLMAYVAERISNRTFEEAVREEIFNPMEMESSSFLYQVDGTREDLAKPYLSDQGGFRSVQHEINR